MDKQRQRVERKIEDVKRAKSPLTDYLMQLWKTADIAHIYSELNLLP